MLLLRQHLSRIECLNKKAKLTHLDLLKDIYTPEKLSALKTVRYSLDKKKTEVESVGSIFVSDRIPAATDYNLIRMDVVVVVVVLIFHIANGQWHLDISLISQIFYLMANTNKVCPY